jgi:hypothetical protein
MTLKADRSQRELSLCVIGTGVNVCEGGPLGSVSLPEDATDRGAEPTERALSIEVLAALIAVVADLTGEQSAAR